MTDLMLRDWSDYKPDNSKLDEQRYQNWQDGFRLGYSRRNREDFWISIARLSIFSCSAAIAISFAYLIGRGLMAWFNAISEGLR